MFRLRPRCCYLNMKAQEWLETEGDISCIFPNGGDQLLVLRVLLLRRVSIFIT